MVSPPEDAQEKDTTNDIRDKIEKFGLAAGDEGLMNLIKHPINHRKKKRGHHVMFSETRIPALMNERTPTEPSKGEEDEHMNRFVEPEKPGFEEVLGGDRGESENE